MESCGKCQFCFKILMKSIFCCLNSRKTLDKNTTNSSYLYLQCKIQFFKCRTLNIFHFAYLPPNFCVKCRFRFLARKSKSFKSYFFVSTFHFIYVTFSTLIFFLILKLLCFLKFFQFLTIFRVTSSYFNSSIVSHLCVNYVEFNIYFNYQIFIYFFFLF